MAGRSRNLSHSHSTERTIARGVGENRAHSMEATGHGQVHRLAGPTTDSDPHLRLRTILPGSNKMIGTLDRPRNDPDRSRTVESARTSRSLGAKHDPSLRTPGTETRSRTASAWVLRAARMAANRNRHRTDMWSAPSSRPLIRRHVRSVARIPAEADARHAGHTDRVSLVTEKSAPWQTRSLNSLKLGQRNIWRQCWPVRTAPAASVSGEATPRQHAPKARNAGRSFGRSLRMGPSANISWVWP